MLFRSFSSVPNKVDLTPEVATGGTKETERKSVWNYPQLVMGMAAIFVYVGVEVTTASNLPEFMRLHTQTETKNIAPFVSLYWASLMIGRWTGSVGALDISKGIKQILRFIMPYIAFGVFLLINRLASHDITPFYVYAFVIIAMIIGDILSKGNPARQLLIFSLMGITANFVGMLADGMVSVYAFIAVGLFCSTLWPCIFTLAIAGLGKHTNEGSGLLIMMIMGGGFISLLQGFLAGDAYLGIQWSYLVGVACFLYLAYYAISVTGILKKQGIDYDKLEGGKTGH